MPVENITVIRYQIFNYKLNFRNMCVILFNHKIIDKISILMYNVNGDEK